jgi:hypothetical protein
MMCACTLVQYTAAPGTVSAAAASKASAIMGAVVGVLISGVYVLVARVTPNIKWSILASVVRVGLDMDPSSTDPRLQTVVNLVEEWPASTVHALGLISSLCFITSMCWSALLGSVASRWTRSWLRWGAIVLVLQYASLSAKGVPVARLGRERVLHIVIAVVAGKLGRVGLQLPGSALLGGMLAAMQILKLLGPDSEFDPMLDIQVVTGASGLLATVVVCLLHATVRHLTLGAELDALVARITRLRKVVLVSVSLAS